MAQVKPHSSPISPRPKAVLYLRVSTGPQVEGTSLASQLAACRQKAEQIGADVVGVYEDVQSGADYHDRHSLQAALSQIERGEANTLIIYDMTRYSRDLKHQQLIKERVLAARGRLEFATFDVGDFSSPESHLPFGVQGVFADFERRKTRERTMIGRRNRAKDGIQTQRSLRPFGYDLVTYADVMQRRFELDQLGKYVIREEEAKYVRQMFEKYADGETIQDLCRWITLSDMPPFRGGKQWWPATVRRILARRIYMGDARYGQKERITDESRLEQGLSKTYYRPVPLSEQIPLDAPPIVSQEIWEKCQVLLQTNQQRYSGQTENRWLLSSLLRCPLCQGHMKPIASKWWGDRETYKTIYQGTKRPALSTEEGEIMSFWQWRRLSHVYLCRNSRILNPEKRCPGFRCPVFWADEQVTKQVFEMLSNPAQLEEYFVLQASQNALENSKEIAQRDQLQQQLVELQSRERNVLMLQERALSNGLDPGLYDGMLRTVAFERQGVQVELEQLQARGQITTEEDARKRAREIDGLLQQTRAVLFAPDEQIAPHEKNKLFHQVIETVEMVPQEEEEKPSFKVIWREN